MSKQLFPSIRQQAASTVIPDIKERDKVRPTTPCFCLEVLSELWCRAGDPKQSTVLSLKRNQTWGSSSSWTLRELHREGLQGSTRDYG